MEPLRRIEPAGLDQLADFVDALKARRRKRPGLGDELSFHGDVELVLRSRGLDPTAARGLLIQGFVAEVLDGMSLEPLRVALEAEVRARLPRLAGEEGA